MTEDTSGTRPSGRLDSARRTVEVTVEIPRGSRNKYEFDHASGRWVLDRVLFSSVHYPADYGFIEHTPSVKTPTPLTRWSWSRSRPFLAASSDAGPSACSA